MKPSNSPTQGQPNPRENRLKLSFGPLFSHSQYFLSVGVDFIWKTDYKKPNPHIFSANTLFSLKVVSEVCS